MSSNRREQLTALLRERIVILDGGMGTMIQLRKLDEAAYAGEKYKEWPCSVKGNNDCLSITQPEMIKEIDPTEMEDGLRRLREAPQWRMRAIRPKDESLRKPVAHQGHSAHDSAVSRGTY